MEHIDEPVCKCGHAAEDHLLEEYPIEDDYCYYYDICDVDGCDCLQYSPKEEESNDSIRH